MAVAAAGSLAACGTPGPRAVAAVAPADLLITPQQLPAGFEPTQLSVADLADGNKGPIESARTADISPDVCRPTADADMNPQLSQDNSAVIAARADDAGLVELVSTVRRDVDADIRATTGGCALTTSTITTGSMRGAQIVARYTEIPNPDLGERASSVRESVLVRSDVTTTLADGTASAQVGYAGYAIVARAGGSPVTVQLTVTSDAAPAAKPPAPPAVPMAAADFTAVFRDAVTAAAAP